MEDIESKLCLPLMSTNLSVLFSSLSDIKLRNTDLMYPPKIGHARGFEKYKDNPAVHEAAYDAYMTGYVSIRLGIDYFESRR